MYQIGIDIGGTNVKIGLLDETLELTAEASIPFPHTTAVQLPSEPEKSEITLTRVISRDYEGRTYRADR